MYEVQAMQNTLNSNHKNESKAGSTTTVCTHIQVHRHTVTPYILYVQYVQ